MMNGMNVMIHFVFMNILMLFGFFSIARADSFKKNLVKRSSIWLNPGLLAEPFPANPTYLITKEFPFFTFSYCGGPYIYDAYLLNTCFKAGEDQDAYYKIVCDQNTAAWVNYIDDACNYAANNLTIAQPGCSEMSVYLCGSSSPNSYEAGNYVAQTYYQDSACKNQISNSAYVSGQCYSLLGFAVKMIGLLEYSYKSSGTCDGSYTTTALSDKCTLDPDTQTYTYYSDVSVQSSSSNSNDEELSGGAIVGIVIAVLFSFALIFAAVAVHCKQRLQGHQRLAANESRTTEMMASNFSVNL